ncbi:hypothetical protein Tco_0177385, partial [Tanacetum coccineum]
IKNLPKDVNINYTLLVGKEKFIGISALNLLDSVPELMHKDLWDICRYGECLEACGVLDHINHDLNCLSLLCFQSDIGKANLNSLRELNPIIITSSNLLFS